MNAHKPQQLPDGLRIGHAQDSESVTGCTVFLFDSPLIAAADIRGSAPATCNFSALHPVHVYPRVHAVLFTGGSAFGLSAVAGVQNFLEQRKIGFDVGVTTIPIVPAAAIFDLNVGAPQIRPTAELAYSACVVASSDIPATGCVGVGTGASVGKFFGIKRAMKGGFGMASAVTAGGAQVWAFCAVNAYGDVWLPHSDEIIAGSRTEENELKFADTEECYARGWKKSGLGSRGETGENTTLVMLITTGALDVLDAKKVAEASTLGLADAVRPACTIYDGDLSIAASIGEVKEDLTALCVIARRVVAAAIVDGVKQATPMNGLPAWRSFL